MGFKGLVLGFIGFRGHPITYVLKGDTRPLWGGGETYYFVGFGARARPLNPKKNSVLYSGLLKVYH